ncbi:hypothetical protein HK099_007351 [Clydaea vesicula]|uniref:Peroxisomal targeting signal 1 receptor n=1 Tax=Clydaea vesicula TaxID=447962 RepID=A0AAD5XTQ5_9FUNG|nr:hypothetical protein HK099_007351 [Clydaea vesicula]
MEASCVGESSVQKLGSLINKDKSLYSDNIRNTQSRISDASRKKILQFDSNANNFINQKQIINSNNTPNFLNQNLINQNSLNEKLIPKNVIHINDEWSHEFMKGKHLLNDNARFDLTSGNKQMMESVFQSHFTTPANSNWNTEFQTFQAHHQNLVVLGDAEMEKAFERAQGHSWEQEFITENSWEKEFEKQQLAEAEDWADEKITNDENFTSEALELPQNLANKWAQNFNGTQVKSGEWEEDFLMEQHASSSSNWATEYHESGPEYDWNSRNDNISWVDEFNGISLNAKDETLTWNEEFQNSVTRKGPSNLYPFTKNNLFLNQSIDSLQQLSTKSHLSESILSLEALVQMEPNNAQCWYQLGMKQQENENDHLAVVSLLNALELNPKLLDAWIALAVSYANENSNEGVLESLTKWIENNDLYKNKGNLKNRQYGREGHEFLTKKFLALARERPLEVDADVQDYLLWNKLGATLANSKNSVRSLDAYFNALSINPEFIRARYNLAISCISLQQYTEAAEHLLGGLQIQEQINGADNIGKINGNEDISSLRSDGCWKLLKLICDVQRPELTEACNQRNLNFFRDHFEF